MNMFGEEYQVIDSFRGDYFFLSNFYPVMIHCYFGFDGNIMRYEVPSSEHLYQMFKATNLVDLERIGVGTTAAAAKKIGSTIECRKDWEIIVAGAPRKIWVMEECLQMKFFQNEDLGKKLVDTGDAKLIEGNTWGDTFWGVCDGKGENNLGKLLMSVREDFKKYLTTGELPVNMQM